METTFTIDSGETSVFDIRGIDAVLKFTKTHPDAKLPTKNHSDDTGFDVYSVESKLIPARGNAVVDVGLEFADITPGFWVKVEGRSGLGFKHGITPHAGIIDCGYRGNAGILLRNFSDVDYQVNAGDRIAQFVVYRNYEVSVLEGDATETSRGDKGFGSSGQ
jgi:dUTP pyrophosphatase